MTKTKTYLILGVIMVIWIVAISVWLPMCGGMAAHGQRVKNPADSLPKQKTYTLTYERNSLYVNLDSLNAMGRYLGSALDKDSWVQIISIYNRVLGRVATMGHLDSTEVKKK
jgi:hypothetical protein